ncbi:MAG: hypothetical protein KGL35_21585 [Bradyrhizobium sp.]|nr:hypothetical protein [Bradyrhizobium sp.]
MAVVILPVAEWMPDMPDLATATSIALNVTPITQMSYGPQPSLSEYSTNALDGMCIGGIAAQGSDLSVNIFAGTSDKLYRMTDLAPSWSDISGGTYTTASGENWRFALFNSTVIATNFAQVLQAFTIGTSSTFAALFTGTAWAPSTAYSTIGELIIANGNRYELVTAGTSASSGSGPNGTGSGITDGTAVWNYQAGPPPQARYSCTPKGFLMVGNTYDAVGGNGPRRIWWSVNNDPTSFPAPGTDAAITGMSDYNDFQGNIGEVTGLVDSLANADVAIFFRHSVWRGLFVGPPNVFDFFPVENARGTYMPNAIVPVGRLVYYIGEDGFYAFDGASSTPFGVDKFNAWFFENVNGAYPENVVGAADIPNRRILWAFPSALSTTGAADTVLIYRWDLERASYLQLGANAVEWLMRTLTFGLSPDSMAAAGFADTDTLPASFDSPVWIGGVASLMAVDGSHKLSFFTGPNLAASVATQTKQLTPGRRSFVQSARPLVDLTTGVPSVSFAGRVQIYDEEVFGAAVAPNSMGECPQRSDARYHNAQVTIPAGAVWKHIIGVETTFVPGGAR